MFTKRSHSVLIKSGAILLLAAALFLFPGRAAASPNAGQIAWFGNVGMNGYNGAANEVIPQPDGKLLVGGAASPYPYPYYQSSNFALARLTASGGYDSSFNAPTTSFCICYSGITGLAVRPDGKVVAAGYSGYTSGNPAYIATLARYNSNGTLDTSFGNNGTLVTGILMQIGSILLQPDGKILAAGSTQDQFTLARFNSDGTIDTTFGAGGFVRTPLLGGSSHIVKLLRQPDGKLVAGGRNDPGDGGGTRFAVARYNPDGSLDNSFGSGGFNTVTFVPGGDNIPSGAALAPNGRIVMGGCTPNSTLVAVARFNPNGSLDNSFDGDGRVTTATGSASGCAQGGVTVQANGKIVAAGFGYNGSSPIKQAIVRYNVNGTLDQSFDGDGILLFGAGISSFSYDVITQATGDIVVIGKTSFDKTGGSGTVYGIFGDNVGRSVTADFDGEGLTDLSIFRGSTAEWWIQQSAFNNDVTVQFGANGNRLVPAEFTGDGRTDVAEWVPATGEWRILKSENSTVETRAFGSAGDIPAPADYDGDFFADVAVFRPATGYWYINNSSDGSFTIFQFGVAGDVPVAGDYDGDGKTDVGIFRANASTGNGEWWIQRSRDGIFVTVFGSNTDKPVAADYTGDGKTDVAVWRPADGFWIILRSEDFNYFGGPFGSATDLPTPGDYDGDGKTDIAVFRPSEGNWYVQKSTGGISIRQFGGAGDKPIPGVYVP